MCVYYLFHFILLCCEVPLTIDRCVLIALSIYMAVLLKKDCFGDTALEAFQADAGRHRTQVDLSLFHIFPSFFSFFFLSPPAPFEITEYWQTLIITHRTAAGSEALIM